MRSQKMAFFAISLSLVCGAAAGAQTIARPILNAVTGVTAHTICSDHFVTGLDQNRIWTESLQPFKPMAMLKPNMTIRVDKKAGLVEVSALGASRTAYFTKRRGCTVLKRMPPIPKVESAHPLVKWDASFSRPTPNVSVNPALTAALDDAFSSAVNPARGMTRAIVVVHKGKIVAERYGQDIGIETPLNGYSVSKSVTATIIGLLADRGKIDVQEKAPFAEWKTHGDPRRDISIDNMLRMTTGLDLDETHTGLDPATNMWFSQPDMVAFGRAAKLKKPIGTSFSYSSPTTMLLAGLARERVGGKPNDLHDYLAKEFLGPLGMNSVIFETDAAGTPVGSSYFFASARDWAKLGQLYVAGGTVDGQRFFAPQWVDYVRKRTLDSGYGAGFWIPPASRTSDKPGDSSKLLYPTDMFLGLGYLGQSLMIVPSRDLVIVRLGANLTPASIPEAEANDANDFDGSAKLLRNLVALVDAGELH